MLDTVERVTAPNPTWSVIWLHGLGADGNDFAPIVLEENVWLGSRVIVLRGVTIGAHSVIGAGSVVVNDVPARSVAVGVPARVVRAL